MTWQLIGRRTQRMMDFCGSRIDYVTQGPAVYADVSVRSNLDYFAAILGADVGRVQTVLRGVALHDAAGQPVGTLSGGQRARTRWPPRCLGAQAASAVALGPLGLDVRGSSSTVVVLAVLDALLDTALGLLLPASARTEFQAGAVPARGRAPAGAAVRLFVPREAMAAPLR